MSEYFRLQKLFKKAYDKLWDACEKDGVRYPVDEVVAYLEDFIRITRIGTFGENNLVKLLSDSTVYITKLESRATNLKKELAKQNRIIATIRKTISKGETDAK
jgi:hypothetical protein